MSASERHLLGLDVGATKIAAGLGRDDGTLLAQKTAPTIRGDPGALVDQLEALVLELVGERRGPERRLPPVGIGICGGVGDAGIVSSPIAMGWTETVCLADLLAERLSSEVSIDNDVNAGAVGEQLWGAGRGHEHFVYLSVGTGIGAGLVLNGELFRGAHRWAGEIGHMSVDVHGIQCPCGNRGCIEATAGGKYLAQWVTGRLADPGTGPTSVLASIARQNGTVTARDIFAAARNGDAYAEEVLDTVAHHLAAVVVNLVNLLDVTRVVVGGGMVQGDSPLLPAVRDRMSSWSPFLEREPGILEAAALQANAGVIGAMGVALMSDRRWGRSRAM